MNQPSTYSINHIDSRIHSVDINHIQLKIQNNLRYYRNILTFLSGFSDKPREIHLPEIDKLELLQPINNSTQNTKSLFTQIQSLYGHQSDFVNHFARIEKQKGNNNSYIEYSDPEHPNIRLFTKFQRRDFADPSPKYYVYQLDGGINLFQRLMRNEFLLLFLIKAIQQGIIQVGKLDLALDLNINIMPYIRDNLQKGQYVAFKRRPTGFVDKSKNQYKDDFPSSHELIPLGKYSSFMSKAKKQDIDYKLKTVYFGHKQVNDIIILFYDKDSQLREKKSAFSDSTNRIEIRFSRNKNSTKEFDQIVFELLESYLDPNGWEERTLILLQTICQNVVFTSQKTSTIKDLTYSKPEMAPWWFEILYSLAVAFFLDKTNEEIETLFKQKDNVNQQYLSMFLEFYRRNNSRLPTASTIGLKNSSETL
jgi:hypothetical protein